VATMFVNPCMAIMRGINAVMFVGGVLNAYDNIKAENYGAAALDVLGAALSAAGARTSCFTADMELLTTDGWKRMDQLRVWDEVLSCDEHDPLGKLVPKRLEEIFNEYARIWEVTAAGKVIRTTGEHPFYVQHQGWTRAAELKPGDVFRTNKDTWIDVESVKETEDEEEVYNCRISEFHTYFVGRCEWGFGVWAHNSCAKPITGRRQHGDFWHNSTGTRMAGALELTHGKGNVRWNQGLVDSRGRSLFGKKPDIQYKHSVNGKIYIIELQSKGQSINYMNRMRNQYRALLGPDFGGYDWIPHP
jgi:Pretoxin HINT domain